MEDPLRLKSSTNKPKVFEGDIKDKEQAQVPAESSKLLPAGGIPWNERTSEADDLLTRRENMTSAQKMIEDRARRKVQHILGI